VELFKYIQLIPFEKISKDWTKAKEIMESVDEEDVIFVATALSLENSVIWSDDKHFDEQKAIKNLKTEDIINLVKDNS
jgi:predicted nucleic acid-binding protein